MTHLRIELMLVNYRNSDLLLCRSVFYHPDQRSTLRNTPFTAQPGWTGITHRPTTRNRPNGHQGHKSSDQRLLRPNKSAELEEESKCAFKSLFGNGH